MARIRTVKPDLFSDEKLARVSIPARFLYIGLFTEADDEGRLYASPKRLAGALFPHDQLITASRVSRWLGELEGIERIERYEAEGIEYLWLPRFGKHQKISHPTPSRLPSPSGKTPEPHPNGSGPTPESLHPSHTREEQGTGNREQGISKTTAPSGAESFDAETWKHILGSLHRAGWTSAGSGALTWKFVMAMRLKYGAVVVRSALDDATHNDSAPAMSAAAYFESICVRFAEMAVSA